MRFRYVFSLRSRVTVRTSLDRRRRRPPLPPSDRPRRGHVDLHALQHSGQQWGIPADKTRHQAAAANDRNSGEIIPDSKRIPIQRDVQRSWGSDSGDLLGAGEKNKLIY